MYNLIQYASGPIKIYNLPIHLYYTQFLKNEACIPSGPHADVPEISLIASVIVA